MGMNEVAKKVGGVLLRVDKGSYRAVQGKDKNGSDTSSLIVEFVLNGRVRDKETFQRLEQKLDGMVVFAGTAKDELIDALGQEIDDRDKVEAALREKVGLLETHCSLKDGIIGELREQLEIMQASNERLRDALRPLASQLGLEL